MNVPFAFRLHARGALVLEVDWPEALQSPDLAASVQIHVTGQDWAFSRNTAATRWKCAGSMASNSAIIAELAPNEGRKTGAESTSPRTVTGVLRAQPLALRIGLLKTGKAGKEGFFLMGCLYPSQKLNAGTVAVDPDDITVIARVPALATKADAIIRMPPSATRHGAPGFTTEEEQEHLTLLERTLRACTPLADQPGAIMTPLHIEFNSQLEIAVKDGTVRLVHKSGRRTSSTSRHSTSRQSRREASTRTAGSGADTDGSSAPPDASIPGKYVHSLPSRWFIRDVPVQFRQLYSSSISRTTAAHYTTQVDAWISFCSAQTLNPLSPSVEKLVEYLSIRSAHAPLSSIKLSISAIRKFIIANLADSSVLNAPPIRALVSGLANMPRSSGPRLHTHRLAMNRPALSLAGHVLQLQDWPDRDKTTLWALFLISYFASARVGDLVSNRANHASSKTLCWADVSITGPRATIFVRSPKVSVNNAGHSFFLLRNPDVNFCPVSFLAQLKENAAPGPVFVLASGKLVTIPLVNKILKQTSLLADVPAGAAYSAHSFRAALPTAIALHQSAFSPAEVRAAGRWRSGAVDRYVRCQRTAAESIAARVYSLNL